MATGEASLGSQYVLLDEIGAGAMGAVWRARHRETGELVAVKLLRDGLTGDQELVMRFVQERNVMRSLRHPNIVTVRDFVIEGDRLAMVMDLVEGGSLQALLRRHGTLPPAEAARMMAEVADALAAAHAAGVVHRDVKPANILIEQATGRVRLTDFGVARIVYGPGLTQSTAIIGTPMYLAPETAMGEKPTPAVDVYAIGLILYQLLAGRPPFIGDHPVALIKQHSSAAPRRLPGMPDALWSLIARCAAKNPADRPTAAQVAAELRRAMPALAGLPPLPPVPWDADPSITSEPLPASAAGPAPAVQRPGGAPGTGRPGGMPGAAGMPVPPGSLHPGPLSKIEKAGPYLPLGLIAGLGAVLAYLWKWPCRFGGVWNAGVGQFTHYCYTDIYPLFWAERLNEGKIPYLDHPVEYPVGIGAIMEFARRLAGGDGVRFYDITVVLMGIALVAGVLLLGALAGRDRWHDALWYAIGPAVILCAFINWDLAAGALALGGLLAWARRRQYLAGVLLALAVATKFYPLMFFGALFLLTLRTGRWRPFLQTAGAAAVTWLAVNVPVMLANFDGWKRFYEFSRERGADWGSVWFFFQRVDRPEWLAFLGDPELLNGMAMAAVAVLLLGVAVLTLAAPRRPRLAQVCFLALAAFMITNKVWSPQFVLWLVPIAVLARPRPLPLLIWQLAECWYFFAIWRYLVTQVGGPEAYLGIGDGPYFLALWARALTVIMLMVLVVRDILRPEDDVTRTGGVDDRSGGVFDRAPDRFALRIRPRAAAQPAETT